MGTLTMTMAKKKIILITFHSLFHLIEFSSRIFLFFDGLQLSGKLSCFTTRIWEDENTVEMRRLARKRNRLSGFKEPARCMAAGSLPATKRQRNDAKLVEEDENQAIWKGKTRVTKLVARQKIAAILIETVQSKFGLKKNRIGSSITIHV